MRWYGVVQRRPISRCILCAVEQFHLWCIALKKETHVFLLFYFMHQTFGTVLQHNNATLLFANNNVQNSPPAFYFHRVKPKQTHLKWVGETCSRQSECPSKCVWVVSGSQTGVDGHPSASDLQPERCWAVIDSWGGPPTYVRVTVAKYLVIELYLGREVCSDHELWPEPIVECNRMNLIFSWISEQQFSSEANQIQVSFFLKSIESTNVGSGQVLWTCTGRNKMLLPSYV